MKTPTSLQYPILDNRPIDQWKVTELKEELKRRGLKTGGLKDELIRRLSDAFRPETEETNVEADIDNGVEEPGSETFTTDAPVKVTQQPVVEAGDSEMVDSGNAEETMDNAEEAVGETKENVGNVGVNVVSIEVNHKDSGEQLGKDESVQEHQSGLGNDPGFEEGIVITDANVVSIEVDDKDSGEQLCKDESVEEHQPGLGNDPISGDGIVTTIEVASVVVGDEVGEERQSGLVGDPISREGTVIATGVASVFGEDVSERCLFEKALGWDVFVDGKTKRDNGDSGEQEHFEDVMPAHEDAKLDSSVQNNQVSEVSTSLGFSVRSNISVSDSLSIIEKNDLKDNLIADNVKLESDVKPEMVQPSSSDLVPDGGESHPRDVDEPHENKNSVEEIDNSFPNADMSPKNHSTDLGSEKINLDRSSGNDFMEEDALECKQIDSNDNSEDLGEKTQKNDVATIKAETPVAATIKAETPVATTIKAETPVATTMDTDLPAEKKVIHDQKNDVATLSEKRKLSDEESVLNSKPAKRQHRWKTESNIVTDPQISLIYPPASAQDVPQSTALRRNFSRTDSSGANDPPKEREVPPLTKPATNSLRIDRFLRPFTLKAVQELLGKTGTVTSFWMDQIKTHCYVTYSSIEEAVETRNAVYNLQWPPNGGRQLLAEFVNPEEVKSRLEPPPPSPAPAPPVNAVISARTKAPEPPTIPQPSPRQQSLRQQKAQQPGTLPPPPPIQNQAPVRELRPPPPPPIEKVDVPIVTLDDLFRKTKATPRIYYLPLSDELVAARRQNTKQ